MEAKKIAQEGRYLDADMFIVEEAKRKYKEMYGEKFSGGRPRYDRTHPGFHFLVSTGSNGKPLGYRRETNLETGEILVFRTDNRGDWERRVFVSRTDDIIVMELITPEGATINAKLSLVAARLKNPSLMWRMLSTFANFPFVNTSFITCHNPGPRIYNLDSTFSMPAVLMEMLVFSEPGMIELLPAIPQDRFIRGTLKGVKARGGITVEQLHRNKTLGRVNVILRSEKAQSVKLRFGIDLRFVNAMDDSDRHRVSYQKKGQWNISLPAGRSFGLNCRF
ncbi:hypothetical protein ES705_49803 [subsurface metagenome]